VSGVVWRHSGSNQCENSAADRFGQCRPRFNGAVQTHHIRVYRILTRGRPLRPAAGGIVSRGRQIRRPAGQPFALPTSASTARQIASGSVGQASATRYRSCPAEGIALHPVGSAVGNVRNDGPELVAPAADLFTA